MLDDTKTAEREANKLLIVTLAFHCKKIMVCMKFVEMLGTVDILGSESKNFSHCTRLEDSLSQ